MSATPAQSRCPQCGLSFASMLRICPDDGTVLEQEAAPTALNVGTILDGKYRLDTFVSQGGMGSVFRATHVMLGRTIAVKLINPDILTSPDIVRRFQREARAATTLNHPNIAGVFDLGQTSDGTLYIAMEFVDGPTLKSVLTKGPLLPAARIVALLRQVSSALAIAHHHGIVHRDLKPQNILVARDIHGHEIAKLVDFGIAKTFDDTTQLTQTGFALGTPQYMAPEQAEGRAVDARSDIYSLGVILYEMLAGQVPFSDLSTPAVLVKHIKETPERPSLKNPAVSRELEAIAMRSLEKNPANRFQTAEEFSAALDTVPLGVASTPPSMAAAPSESAVTVVVSGTQSSKVPVKISVVVIAVLGVVGWRYYSTPPVPQAAATPIVGTPANTASAPTTPEQPTPATPASRPRPDPPPASAAKAFPAPPPAPPPVAASPVETPPSSERAAATAATPEPGAAPFPGARGRRGFVPPALRKPTVAFRCGGAPVVCAALRSAVEDALQNAGMVDARSFQRADVIVDAVVTPLEQRIARNNGAPVAVRTFAIALNGAAPRTGEEVPMPPKTTVSFDPRAGVEGANEKGRLVAADIVERLQAYASNRSQK